MSHSTLSSQISLDLNESKPPIVQVEAKDDATRWAAVNRDILRAIVSEHGSILVRGFAFRDAVEIGAVFQTLANNLMTEIEPFDPRQTYSHGVYASTKWAPNQPMCSHHEMSYTCEFPGLLLFACLQGPTSGGATGVADSGTILKKLPAELTKRFEQEGWLLIRNYNEDMGASIAESFGTDDRNAVEAYCRANGIEYEWQSEGGLQTRQRRSAIIHHPTTGQRCWFNQIAFLNEWTLDPEIREYLVEVFGSDGLPFNTYFGNGDPVGEDVVNVINGTYEANIAREPLQAGDLMLIDNIRIAHSREPFKGQREVLVGLSDQVRLANCSPSIKINCST